ncbi:phage tail baseplate protein [Methyloceanibacter stevinii]|uniref:GTA baseplate fiber-binding domain-containing protein n=1 Tax=Methyloceanibacter stevinii TaxID=1774970 RepID=UPI001FCD974B|nr:hypothetical protein [Methyloceanibacter stevinii]
MAALVEAGTYDLSILLRGLNGTEGAMRDPVPAGARFLLVNSSVTALNLRPDDVGLALNYKYGPVSESFESDTYGSVSYAAQGLGLRPLSPVHIQGKRDAATGDWFLEWIRRTRFGGDSWEGLEVPLGEDVELYRLDILDEPGGSVLRSVDSNTPSFAYSAAMQSDDFGAPQWNVPLRVAQVSPVYGPGPASEQLIWDYQH